MVTYFWLYSNPLVLTSSLTSHLSETQSVRRIHCPYSALSFYAHHPERVGWSNPAMLMDGVWPSPLYDREPSVGSAPTPAAGTCRTLHNDTRAHPGVWWLCWKDNSKLTDKTGKYFMFSKNSNKQDVQIFETSKSMEKNTHMSTQHCGLTAPMASTTVYLFGAVHSTGIKIEPTNKINSLLD